MGDQLTEEQKTRFKRAFCLFDKNGSGTIPSEKLGTVLRSLRILLPPEDKLKEMIDEVDLYKTGTLDVPEFFTIMAQIEDITPPLRNELGDGAHRGRGRGGSNHGSGGSDRGGYGSSNRGGHGGQDRGDRGGYGSSNHGGQDRGTETDLTSLTAEWNEAQTDIDYYQVIYDPFWPFFWQLLKYLSQK